MFRAFSRVLSPTRTSLPASRAFSLVTGRRAAAVAHNHEGVADAQYLLALKPGSADPLVSAKVSNSVKEAVAVMNAASTGFLVVRDDSSGEFRGVLSERDCMRSLGSDSAVDPDADVSQLMTPKEKVVWVYPSTEMTVCLELMREHKIRHLVIAEDESFADVKGVVSIKDLMVAMLEGFMCPRCFNEEESRKLIAERLSYSE